MPKEGPGVPPDGGLAPPGQMPRGHNARIDRLRLRHLRLLDLIAREGSLSAAADALGVSQPGATKMLQEVETAFGCALVERTAKGGRLTPAGLHTLDRLRVALQAVGTARAALQAQPEVPLVRLGMLPLVGIHALSHVVAALEAEASLPRLQIRLDTVEGLLAALNDGRVDCAVGVLDGVAQGTPLRRLRVTPLWEEALVIVAARDHPLLRRRPLTLEQVRDADWVQMPPGSSNRRALAEVFQRAGLEPPAARIETESFHIALSLVAGSRLLAAVPESAYRQHQGSVRVLPLPSLLRGFAKRSMVFVTLADAPALPAVAALSQWFQHYAGTQGAAADASAVPAGAARGGPGVPGVRPGRAR